MIDGFLDQNDQTNKLLNVLWTMDFGLRYNFILIMTIDHITIIHTSTFTLATQHDTLIIRNTNVPYPDVPLYGCTLPL